jgi:hypothetical protein
MNRRALFAIPVAALFASPLLIDCSPFQINCVTAQNCEDNQACVAGLCVDATDGGMDGSSGNGGTSGNGGASSTSATSGTGAASGTGGSSGTGDGGTCATPCTAPKPFCVDDACVQCTQKSDCSGLTPCCTNNTCVLGAC